MLSRLSFESLDMVFQEATETVAFHVRDRRAGDKQTRQLRIKFPHFGRPVGMDYVARQYASTILKQVVPDNGFILLPESMCGPPSAITVRCGCTVANAL